MKINEVMGFDRHFLEVHQMLVFGHLSPGYMRKKGSLVEIWKLMCLGSQIYRVRNDEMFDSMFPGSKLGGSKWSSMEYPPGKQYIPPWEKETSSSKVPFEKICSQHQCLGTRDK